MLTAILYFQNLSQHERGFFPTTGKVCVMTYELGVDVSKWQTPEKVDWRKIRSGGYSFVFARYSYGVQIDSTFFSHSLRAINAGLRIAGYQYMVPQHNIAAQANLASQIANDLEMPFALDIEQAGLSRSMIDDWIGKFLLQSPHLIIYTSKFKWLQCYGTAIHTYASRLPLWVANYTNAEQPMLPSGWSTWTYWQYSSTGRINGYDGDIDLNRCKPPWTPK